MNVDGDTALTPRQAGRLLGVGPKTLCNAADQGIVECFRTRGNHRRFLLSVIDSHQRKGTFATAAANAQRRRPDSRETS